jgi:chemotaxis protein CheC
VQRHYCQQLEDSTLTQQLATSEAQREAWLGLIKKAVSNSIFGLSEMAGESITVSTIDIATVDVKDIPEHAGGAAVVAVGILLAVEDKPDFHMALLHSPEAAYSIIDILLDQPDGTTTELGELELSTLGEMGNIMCSFFLNAMGDETGIVLKTTPPTVRMDMTGAVLDYILAEIMMDTDKVDLLETRYGTSTRQVDGTFVVIPSADFREQTLKKGVGV